MNMLIRRRSRTGVRVEGSCYICESSSLGVRHAFIIVFIKGTEKTHIKLGKSDGSGRVPVFLGLWELVWQREGGEDVEPGALGLHFDAATELKHEQPELEEINIPAGELYSADV